VDRREFLRLGVAAAPVLLGRPGRQARAAPSRALALVTADTESHVTIVALASGRVVGRLATLPAPRSIESGRGGRAVVAHTAEGALSLLEGPPVRVRRVLRSFKEPRYTAISPDGRHAFVTDAARGEVVVVDLRRARVVAGVEVGAHARHITLAPRGDTLWTALGSRAQAIAVVDVADPLRPRLVRSVRPSFEAHDVGFSPSGRRLWVTAGAERRVALYAADGHKPLVVHPADTAPQHVTFGRGVAYIASGEDGRLRLHALADGRVLRAVRIPRGSYNVQRAGNRVLTPSLGTGALTILSLHGRVLAQPHVARAAHDACVMR
jgi:hypothetical protein